MIFDSSLTWPRRGDWPDGLAFAGVWRDTAKPFWPRPTGRRVCTYAECGSANRETHTHTYTSLTRSRFTQPTGSSPDYSEKSDACAQPLIPGHCSIYPSASSSSNSLSLSHAPTSSDAAPPWKVCDIGRFKLPPRRPGCICHEVRLR